MGYPPHIRYFNSDVRIPELAARSVYELVPNDAFFDFWKKTSPDNAALVEQVSTVLLQQQIDDLSDTATARRLATPRVVIDRDADGNLGIGVMDGMKRIASHSEVGYSLPIYVMTSEAEDLSAIPELQAFLKPLSPAMKQQLTENTDPPGEAPLGGESIEETIRRWVRENAEKLMREFKAKYGAHVGEQIFQHYARHGRMPRKDVIQDWIREAERRGISVEPCKASVRAIQTEWAKEHFTQIAGPEAANALTQQWLDGGGMGLRRNTIEAAQAGVRGEELAAVEAGTGLGKPWVGREASVEHEATTHQTPAASATRATDASHTATPEPNQPEPEKGRYGRMLGAHRAGKQTFKAQLAEHQAGRSAERQVIVDRHSNPPEKPKRRDPIKPRPSITRRGDGPERGGGGGGRGL